jgi:transposase-like protein
MPAISYLNHVLGQDHRFVRKRMVASPWFRSVKGALRTVAGYEAMNMIRKGQVRCRPSRPDSRAYRRDLSQMTCLSPITVRTRFLAAA